MHTINRVCFISFSFLDKAVKFRRKILQLPIGNSPAGDQKNPISSNAPHSAKCWPECRGAMVFSFIV